MNVNSEELRAHIENIRKAMRAVLEVFFDNPDHNNLIALEALAEKLRQVNHDYVEQMNHENGDQ